MTKDFVKVPLLIGHLRNVVNMANTMGCEQIKIIGRKGSGITIWEKNPADTALFRVDIDVEVESDFYTCLSTEYLSDAIRRFREYQQCTLYIPLKPDPVQISVKMEVDGSEMLFRYLIAPKVNSRYTEEPEFDEQLKKLENMSEMFFKEE